MTSTLRIHRDERESKQKQGLKVHEVNHVRNHDLTPRMKCLAWMVMGRTRGCSDLGKTSQLWGGGYVVTVGIGSCTGRLLPTSLPRLSLPTLLPTSLPRLPLPTLLPTSLLRLPLPRPLPTSLPRPPNIRTNASVTTATINGSAKVDANYSALPTLSSTDAGTNTPSTATPSVQARQRNKGMGGGEADGINRRGVTYKLS